MNKTTKYMQLCGAIIWCFDAIAAVVIYTQGKCTNNLQPPPKFILIGLVIAVFFMFSGLFLESVQNFRKRAKK